MTNFDLPNYSQYYTTEKSCKHGGLVMYIHSQFSVKSINILEDIHGWERQCIEISHKSVNSKKYIICNVYKPPNLPAEEFNMFVREFSNMLLFISNLHRSAYICGDFNIDLLQIESNHQYNVYFENIISSGYNPKITLQMS